LKILGHRHTGIIVRDIESMASFYLALGFKQTRRDLEQGDFVSHLIGLENSILETIKLALENGYIIELMKYISHEPLNRSNVVESDSPKYYFGYDHISFTVDNIDEVIARVLSLGGELVSSPKSTNPGLPSIHAYVKDPEKNIIHLAQNIYT
jgi:catechol 2,3-dioxygenase-like lactoylglutathione lyase family enzyme